MSSSATRRLLFHLALVACAVFMLAHAAAAQSSSPRERVSFNAGWRFQKDDPPGAEGRLSYEKIKESVTATGRELVARPDVSKLTRVAGGLGEDVAYTRRGFDDTSWRRLDLPHDWGIEGPFRQEYPGETGKLPWWGVGWYRKHFDVPASDRGRRLYLDIDGAMSYATVWLNGRFVGGWPYGYASFRLDLTPFVEYGAENVLAVRLDNPPDSSRWYPGGGIYRNVWLVKTAPVHVAHWGTFRHDARSDEALGNRPHQRDASTTTTVRRSYVTVEDARSTSTTPTGRKSARPVAVTDPSGFELAPRNSQARSRRERPHRQPETLEPGAAEPLHGRDDGRCRTGRPSTATRRSSASAPSSSTPTRGLPPQRRAGRDQRRLQPPRPRRARRGAERARARTTARNPEGDGRQRHPHQPQPARARAARPGRPHGAARDGRSVRRVAAREEEERLPPALRRLAREGPARARPARPQSSFRHPLEHRQRDRRAAQRRRAQSLGSELGAHRPRGRPDAPRHRPVPTTQRPATTASRRPSTSSATTTSPRSTASFARRTRSFRSTPARQPRPSARAASTSSPSSRTSCKAARTFRSAPTTSTHRRGRRRPTASSRAQDEFPFVRRRVRLDGLRLPRRADALQRRRRRTCSTSPTRPSARAWRPS